MKVILREDREKLGKRGEVVEVAPGYARNFLLPRGLAFEATPKSMRLFEEEKRAKAAHERKEAKEIEVVTPFDLDIIMAKYL